MEAACESRGDITKLGDLGGTWGSPHASHSQDLVLDAVPLRTGLCDFSKELEIGLCSVMIEGDETNPQTEGRRIEFHFATTRNK